MIKEDDPLFKKNAKMRTEKESHDIDMISDAFEQLANTNVRILTYFLCKISSWLSLRFDRLKLFLSLHHRMRIS